MLCNTQSPPDLRFHWFFVAAQYEAARPAAEPATSHKRPAEEVAEVATQQVGVAGAGPGSGVQPRRSTTINKDLSKTPLAPKVVKWEAQEVAARVPAAAQAAVRLAGGHYIIKCQLTTGPRLGAAPPLGTTRPGYRGLLGRGDAVRGHG
jgi:hypothetical protein